MYMQSQTLNISLPKELVKKTDEAAKKVYKNRSEYIRDVLVKQLNKESDWEEIFAEGKKIGEKMGIKSEEDAYRIANEFRHGKKSS